MEKRSVRTFDQYILQRYNLYFDRDKYPRMHKKEDGGGPKEDFRGRGWQRRKQTSRHPLAVQVSEPIIRDGLL